MSLLRSKLVPTEIFPINQSEEYEDEGDEEYEGDEGDEGDEYERSGSLDLLSVTGIETITE